MKRLPALVLTLGLLVAMITGCGAPTPAPTATAVPPTKAPAAPTPAAFSDAFAYCAAVANVDAPDARYTGPKVPDAVVDGLMKAMKMGADAPRAPFAERTLWRCMSGKVYGCNVGANIPCSEKANVDKTPTAAMKEFCTANPASDFIPAAVTGRATVYSWKCTSGVPAVDKELTQPDARGFLTLFWYEVAK